MISTRLYWRTRLYWSLLLRFDIPKNNGVSSRTKHYFSSFIFFIGSWLQIEAFSKRSLQCFMSVTDSRKSFIIRHSRWLLLEQFFSIFTIALAKVTCWSVSSNLRLEELSHLNQSGDFYLNKLLQFTSAGAMNMDIDLNHHYGFYNHLWS